MAVACRGSSGTGTVDAARVQATVAKPHTDTIAFLVPAAAHYCGGHRAMLLQAADERGSGVLALLRYGDSLMPGTFPLLALGDSLTPRGASVAVRYMRGDVAGGVWLDSGTVDVTLAGDALAARVRGSGLEGGVRVGVGAAYTGVRRPARGDTLPCVYQP